MQRSHLSAAIVLLTAVPLCAADSARIEFFEQKIRPVLVEKCYSCHASSAKNLRGGLRLDLRAGVLQGGESGPAVVPGNPDESLLISSLKYDSFEMPPSGKLPDHIIADFAKWVRMGAPDPRDGTIDDDEEGGPVDTSFWSFQPVGNAQPPSVADQAWPRNAIDQFVAAKLEKNGLAPVGDADRTTLLRRAYFDLIGLPPTAEQINDFLNDESDDAFDRVVDELLQSRQFGERWGRHWLDVARFADSSGGARTRLMPHAWRFRNYVVNALNADKPFDQFVIEQIAGDLLPTDDWQRAGEQLTATSFLAMGPHNYELQDKELLRMEVIDEQLDTVGRAFLGMTVGCARCHDHKFDPIPTRDYYAMAGIFYSTQLLVPGNVAGNVERDLPVDPAWQKEIDHHKDELARVSNAKKDIEQKIESLEQARAKLIGLNVDSAVTIDNDAAKVVGKWTKSGSVQGFVGKEYIHSGAADSGDKSVEYTVTLPHTGQWEVRVSYTAHRNRESKAPYTVTHANGIETFPVNQTVTPEIDGVFHSLGEFRFEASRPARVVVTNKNAKQTVIADAVQFIPIETGRDEADSTLEAALGENAREKRVMRGKLKELRQQEKSLQENPPRSPGKVMSVRENESPEDCFVCIRGNVHNPGDVVPRGFPTFASHGSGLSIPDDVSGRLEFAEWVVHPDNPLTGRVIANRIWQHLFGRGIVSTPDNFGQMGTRPTHPQLLDWLARQMIEDGWSIKRTIRRIMLSRTYQLASSPRQLDSGQDPDNALLWRQNRRRLEAECLRDAMMSISGELDLAMPDSLVRKGTKSEYGYKFKESQRSIYVPVFRNTLHPLLEAFDFANPNVVTGRRAVSTLPTQALFLMNSPFVMQKAKLAAARMLTDNALEETSRIELAWQRTLGRRPTTDEHRLTLEFLSDGEPVDQWTQVFQTLFASADFRYVD